MANKSPCQKNKVLVPLKVLALSQEDQDYYYEQKNHYQSIANLYTAWYALQHEKSQTSNSTYFVCDPWKVDFELPSGGLETPLDGLLNET